MQKHIAFIKQESKQPLSQIKKTPNPNLPLVESVCTVENGKPINRVYVKDTGVLSKVGWVIDTDMHQCMLCTVPFTLLTRKHHCRACGLLVCYHCSGNQSLIAGAESLGPQRICNVCHNAETSDKTVVKVVPSMHDLVDAAETVPIKKQLSDLTSANSSDTLSTDNETLDDSIVHSHSSSPKRASASAAAGESGASLNPLSRKLAVEVFNISEGTIPMFIDSRIAAGLENASFLVTNLATVVGQYQQWRDELPMVEPFYAVKCNPDPVIVRLLASLGCNFDCATMGEIDLVLNGLGPEFSFARLGKAASSIVYANPAKMEHMLEFAAKNNVRMTVFDGEDELHKIASVEGHEKFQLLLRLTTDDKASICRFSKKFGCPVAEAPKLLQVAQSLGLTVAGVSFHVGSGCGDSDAYTTALKHARMVFDEAERIGMAPLHIVDLGGGFPGDSGGYGGEGMPTFQNLAAAIRKGVQLFTDPATGVPQEVRFIAEPGRYFVSASTTICTKIYSRKGGNNKYQALYVDDGVYGSFNNVVYDHATPVPLKLSLTVEEDRRRSCHTPTMDCVGEEQQQATPKEAADLEPIPTAVFGPTCDGLDQMCSLDSTLLPRCQVGEWLIWQNQGAYTHTASFVFNGYTHIPTKTYCYL